MRKHCVDMNAKYCFILLKCKPEDNCTFCLPPRSPPIIFDLLHAKKFPFPRKDISRPGHYRYQRFEAVYGKNHTEDGLPVSGKSKWKCPLNRGIQLQYARGWIECVECHIPRVYYAQKKLSEPERQQLIKIDDENRFMCGAQLGIKTENNIIFTDHD